MINYYKLYEPNSNDLIVLREDVSLEEYDSCVIEAIEHKVTFGQTKLLDEDHKWFCLN